MQKIKQNMLVAGDVLGFNNVWRDQYFFYNIADQINTNYFDCRGHQSSHSSCTLRGRYLKQTWSRGHNIRGQGLKKKQPRTDFSSTDPLEAKNRIGRRQSQGPRTKFKKKLWSANFLLFLSAKVFKILHFVKFFMII